MSETYSLFEAPESPPKKQPPDWWNLIARRERGCPEKWCWTSLETLDTTVPREKAQCLVTGAVFSTLLKSGPRKGCPNPKKPDAGTQRRLVISFAEVEAFKLTWEAETGQCSQCGGGGEALAGFSSEKGSRYRTCPRCKGTGKAAPP